jgi:5-methylcytosine-specific restriction protein A
MENTVSSASNPDWTRDELIVALDVYLQHRPKPPGKKSPEIIELSKTLNELGIRLFPTEKRTSTFRNPNGVYMKLMNFMALDPQYTDGGRVGLARGAKSDEDTWAEFASDPNRCRQIAQAIIASIGDAPLGSGLIDTEVDSDIQEAPEGRIMTLKHLQRERNRGLVESKRRQAMKKFGKLACEVCGFDYAVCYGSRGIGFIECHHTKPVATLTEGHTTHIDDLALVCANCHRIIHRGKPWFSVEALHALVAKQDNHGRH